MQHFMPPTRSLHVAELQPMIQQVTTAINDKQPLYIEGGGTKRFYGEACQGEVISTRPLSGIVNYEPSELVITARAGTLLADIENALARQQQYLAFEPPSFADGTTVGGMVAAGLSGPARATNGAVRDFVLGASLLNGRAEVLNFGGQVIKNVAGYDVSRLLCGSLGALGVILEVSLRVSPVPVASVSLRFTMPQFDAIKAVNLWIAQALPINASAWFNNCLTIRLSGASAAVNRAVTLLGGEHLNTDVADAFWQGLRNHTHAFFAQRSPTHTLWRVSVPPLSPAQTWGDDALELVEWHGGLRWVCTTDSGPFIRRRAVQLGGHATRFYGPDDDTPVFTPLAPPLDRIHAQLKKAFDPTGIFNRTRMAALSS